MADLHRLLDSYGKIGADGVTARAEGLKEIRGILLNRNNVKDLQDKGYHSMFESLFKAAIKEKALYSKKVKATVLDRLALCGQVLRLAVETGVELLRAKTVRALCAHITDILHMPGGGLCEPLGVDYLKSLRTCLQHGPHTEHLSRDEWNHLSLFCCRNLEKQLGLDLDAPNGDGNHSTLSREDSFVSRRSGAGSQTSSKLGVDSVELVTCLHLLLGPTSAPILDNVERVCEVLLGFLRSQRTVTRAHQAAFSAINSVLDKISTNRTALSAHVAEEILPIISRLWDTKSPGVKEEMIVSLIFCQPHVRCLTRIPSAVALRRKVENLLDTLARDYSNRTERELLQLDDLDFPDPLRVPERGSNPLSLRAFCLNTSLGSYRSEQTWMVPSLIATIINTLDTAMAPQETADEEEGRVKRQRIYNRSDEIMRSIRSSSSSKKLYGLQIFPFLAERNYINGSQYSSFMQTLQDACSDDNPVITSWAMLSLASCAFIRPALDPRHSFLWEHAWRLCVRYVTAQQTCRAACHLMRVILSYNFVDYARISESIDTMIQSDLAAPTLVDTSLALWCVILRKRSSVAHSSRLRPGERLFQWFISSWQPEEALQKSNAASYSQHTSVIAIVNFLFSCCSVQPLEIHSYTRRTCGPIAQANIRLAQYEGLLAFLLHDDLEGADEQKPSYTNDLGGDLGSRNSDLQLQIIEYLNRQADVVHTQWKRIASAQIQHITVDVLQNFAGFICIASLLCGSTDDESTLGSKLQEVLIPDVVEHVQHADRKQRLTDGILLCIHDLIPKPQYLVEGGIPACFRGPLTTLLIKISEVLKDTKQLADSFDAGTDADDPMDIDDNFMMAERRKEDNIRDKWRVREALQVASSDDAFRHCTTAHVYLAALALKRNTKELFARFTRYLTELSSTTLLMTSSIVHDFISTGAEKLSDEDTYSIIAHLATQMLQGYEVERAETSIGMCIETIDALVARWAPDGKDIEVADACARIFRHVIKVTLEKKITSHNLRLLVVRLLENIIHYNPEYQDERQSARAHFIQLLRDDDTRILYSIAHRLPVLLKAVGSATRASTYVDIENHLPIAGEWTEGLAMRVYTLGLLPQSNRSYIWRLVYRIFETAQLDNGEKYAARALRLVSQALNLSTQRDLFSIFRPQLLSIWLDNHELGRFPFRTFGYRSLEELYRDCQEELASQLLARGDDEQCDYLASSLDTTFEDLAERAFPRIVAYGACSASTIRPMQDGSLRPTTELRMRKRLGNERFNQLIQGTFPVVIACLFSTMEDEGTAEKMLSRDQRLANAYENMKDIIAHGFSTAKAEHLRPNYKLKYIINAMFHVCHTINVDALRIWNPTMFTFVARHLFDKLHPARGPALNLGAIRAIRLLICLAGPEVHKGYPLEMLIHGLKPYIVDEKCAQDTIGLMKYLLTEGKPYLCKRPTFLIGAFLSMVATLRAYLFSSPANEPDSVLQEGPDLSTTSTVREFDVWLAKHLSNFSFEELSIEQNERYQSIVRSTTVFQKHGNALRRSQESEILQHLLDDDRSKNQLLDDVSRQLAFQLLSSSFKRPDTFRDDMFGTDAESMERADSLIRICRRVSVCDDFLQWTARVLGRSYAASGSLHMEWTREIKFEYPTDVIKHQLDGVPRVGILRSIKGLLLAEDQGVVGLSEATLMRIIHEQGQDDNGSLGQVLTREELNAFILPALPNPNKKETNPRPIMLIEKPDSLPVDAWIKNVAITLSTNLPEDPIVNNLRPLLEKVAGLPTQLFPYILHILLVDAEVDDNTRIRDEISQLFRDTFKSCSEKTIQHNVVFIKAILYLRTQITSAKEITKSARDHWVSINYLDVSRAACMCKMYKTALLFAEIHSSENDASNTIPPDLLLEIFKNVEDPDSYYGVDQSSGLQAVLNRLEYEGDGWRSLSFRGANLESLRRLGASSTEDDVGVIDALNTLGMNGMSRSFLEASNSVSAASGLPLENLYSSAWKLEQWDLSCPPACKNHSATVYRALQSVNNTVDSRSIASHLDVPLLDIMKQITLGSQTGNALGEGMRTLAMITETEEAFVSTNSRELEETWDRMRQRESWMNVGRYSDIEEILAMRRTTFSSLAKQDHLRAATQTDLRTARLLEVKTLVGTCKMARSHKVLQHALSAATHLEKLVEPCKQLGVDISAISTLQSANVLWELGESVTSIRMLQGLGADAEDLSQSVVVGRAKLLAKLGSWISDARLEKPDKIMSNYLEKAIAQLENSSTGSDAGTVFHEFACFCDRQLQNTDNIEDYQRVLKLRQNKEAEVRELVQELERAKDGEKRAAAQAGRKTKKTPEMDLLSHQLNKARDWLRIDDAEFKRLKKNQETFLEKAILNFLRSLLACDDYDGDAVRFCALWLKNSSDPKINKAAEALPDVPSRKFAPLMNQLSSRLSDSADTFQSLLHPLALRICVDHPHHGIYQILALMRLTASDDSSRRRKAAAHRVFTSLKENRKAKAVAFALENSTNAYIRLAKISIDKEEKRKGKIQFRELAAKEPKGNRDLWRIFSKDITKYGIPPPTMRIELRADCDYSKLPRLIRFDAEISIASGLSAPKIIRCEASDGKKYKSLFKGGNDDLRQDAIMEQVFEQVSTLLQKSHVTRQRQLTVRTYTVLPLTNAAGIIEFVPNTLPLHDFLLPAHQKYRPKDWAFAKCRNDILAVQKLSRDERIEAYQSATANFQPVMRYFFMHRFNGPDEWFSSRLAYTRTTAAISILGHVLGLGDRHGHNILLDEKSGEIVHIDLGVAFEQGRVLPVPEVVPFRLTRDIVDGMGVTKTEGVFRRCCEFTLAVLRDESYNIITILDVLRYDPLYSWTISPLRMKKMRESQIEPQQSEENPSPVKKPKEESAAEADRALTVVAKKLSKTLSVSATVNELIQQATDEKNLALLFAGWAAWV